MGGPGDPRGRQLFMIGAIASLLDGVGHVAVGSTSPIPATAALLARRRAPGMRVTILGSERHNAFTDGSRELFDCAAQGRIDAFFLSGGQIDGAGRINLVGIGEGGGPPHPRPAVRFPGSFGSAYLYPMVPRVILFREAHDRRALVERVDFVSAVPGAGRPGDRNTGPAALVTGRATFGWRDGGFALMALAPGETPETIRDATGFGFAEPGRVDAATPDAALAGEIDDVVAREVAGDYPAFAMRWLGSGAPSAG